MTTYPSMRALRAFEASARHLSVLQAAAELNVTPGAVSRQIQALEQILGTPLFQRGHRQLALTSAGREFLADIRDPLARIGAAVGHLRRTAHRGAVSLCTYPTFAIRWFMPRWSRFYDRHPDIDVRLTTSLAPVDLERDDYDLAIQTLGRKRPPAGMVAHRLVEIETTPVCAPQLARKLRKPSDLRSVTLLHGEPRPADWDRWLASVGGPPVDTSGGLRFESLNLAFQAAIEGLGVAMGVGAMLESELASGRLVAPFPNSKRLGQPMQLLYAESKARYGSVRLLRDWLLSEAGQMARDDTAAPDRSGRRRK